MIKKIIIVFLFLKSYLSFGQDFSTSTVISNPNFIPPDFLTKSPTFVISDTYTKPDTVKAKMLCSLNDSLFIVNGYVAIPTRKQWYVDWETVPESTPLDENKKPLKEGVLVWESKNR